MKTQTGKNDLTVTTFVAMGSNLNHPREQLARGFKHLCQLPEINVTGCSKLYRSVPAGPQNQPDFYNAVVALDTSLSPCQLLKQLQAIEQKHNRVRKIHWGPRTLDLDILLYGDQIIETKQLTVPHNQMCLRNFVLFPLSDIDAALILPCGRQITSLCQQVGDQGLWVEQDTFFDRLYNRLKTNTGCHEPS